MILSDLLKRFSYHKVSPEDAKKIDDIREAGLRLASLISDTVPQGREQSLAITKIEEAVFWANAAISRDGK